MMSSSSNNGTISSDISEWEILFEYLSVYGVHIALCTLLSAVTAYRREISCNHSYHDEDNDTNISSTCDSSVSGNKTKTTNDVADISTSTLSDCPNACNDQDDNNENITLFDEDDELMTERLLDGAGLYCSGKPILHFAALLWLGLEFFDHIDDNDNGLSAANKDSRSYSRSYSHPHSHPHTFTPEDLLERVGNYSSPSEPILRAIALFMFWKENSENESFDNSSSPRFSSNFCDATNFDCDPFMRGMPSDVHVQIASYLHPRDVVTLSCVSKAFCSITNGSNIWKTLWNRDYSWIVYKFSVGKRAFLRSNCTQWSYSKEFYFRFGQSYLNYILAGQNTCSKCLVGIHSNIYDITSFLFSHPGSPETLMVHSGRDATDFFDDIGHSTAARRLAMSMCVVVDRSTQNNNSYGLHPTSHTEIIDDDQSDENDVALPQRLDDGEDNLLMLRRRRVSQNKGNSSSSSNIVHNRFGRGTLDRIRRRFFDEKEQIRRRVTRKFSNDPNILGHEVNPYFDPFTGQWRIWYTNMDLQTVYLPV